MGATSRRRGGGASGERGSSQASAKEDKPKHRARRALIAKGLVVLAPGAAVVFCLSWSRLSADSAGAELLTVGSAVSPERAARLWDAFAPPRDDDGAFAVDGETERLLEVLHSAGSTGAADKIRVQLRENPLQVGGRLGLCDAIEKAGKEGAQVSERRARYGELAQCYRVLMDAFAFADILPDLDPRRKLLDSRGMVGRVAGERMWTFAEGRPDRLADAIDYLRAGVGSGASCSDTNDCLSAYATLIAALRLSRAPLSELEATLRQSWQVPKSKIRWADIWDVHIQLPNIRQQPFWDPTEVPWLASISARWREIREELDKYIESQERPDAGWAHQPESEHIAGTAGAWNSVELAMNGQWRKEACSAHFPKTCAMLRDRPELNPTAFKWPKGSEGVGGPGGRRPPALMTNVYQVMPGARVLPHFGTHGRLVASLGLKVSRGALLRVGLEKRPWVEGEWLLFDDSFEHDVVNDSPEARYVLAVAMLHPDVCDGC